MPVATISNDAILAYAYSERSPFRLLSAPVEIKALVPRASGNFTLAAAGTGSADAAAETESVPAASSSRASHIAATVKHYSERSGTATEHSHSEMRTADVGAFRRDSQAASSIVIA